MPVRSTKQASKRAGSSSANVMYSRAAWRSQSNGSVARTDSARRCQTAKASRPAARSRACLSGKCRYTAMGVMPAAALTARRLNASTPLRSSSSRAQFSSRALVSMYTLYTTRPTRWSTILCGRLARHDGSRPADRERREADPARPGPGIPHLRRRHHAEHAHQPAVACRGPRPDPGKPARIHQRREEVGVDRRRPEGHLSAHALHQQRHCPGHDFGLPDGAGGHAVVCQRVHAARRRRRDRRDVRRVDGLPVGVVPAVPRRGASGHQVVAHRRAQELMKAGAALCIAICGAALAADPGTAAKPLSSAQILDAAQATDSRRPDPANTLYLELPAGRVVIELAPRFAPEHVANIKALVGEKFFDGLPIGRVQDNYVTQWGDIDEVRKTATATRRLPDETALAWNESLPIV